MTKWRVHQFCFCGANRKGGCLNGTLRYIRDGEVIIDEDFFHHVRSNYSPDTLKLVIQAVLEAKLQRRQ